MHLISHPIASKLTTPEALEPRECLAMFLVWSVSLARSANGPGSNNLPSDVGSVACRSRQTVLHVGLHSNGSSPLSLDSSPLFSV